MPTASVRSPRNPHPAPLPHPLSHPERPITRDTASARPNPPRSTRRPPARARTTAGPRTQACPSPEVEEPTDETSPADPPAAPLLYTAEQAAVLLAVSPGWLRRAAGEGRVYSVLIGKHLRFSRHDLDELIARGHRPRSRT